MVLDEHDSALGEPFGKALHHCPVGVSNYGNEVVTAGWRLEAVEVGDAPVDREATVAGSRAGTLDRDSGDVHRLDLVARLGEAESVAPGPAGEGRARAPAAAPGAAPRGMATATSGAGTRPRRSADPISRDRIPSPRTLRRISAVQHNLTARSHAHPHARGRAVEQGYRRTGGGGLRRAAPPRRGGTSREHDPGYASAACFPGRARMPWRNVSAASRTTSSRGALLGVIPLHRPVERAEQEHPGQGEIPVGVDLARRPGFVQHAPPVVGVGAAPGEDPALHVARSLAEDAKARRGVLAVVEEAPEVGLDPGPDPFRGRGVRREGFDRPRHRRRHPRDADVQDLFEEPFLRVEVVVDAPCPELGGDRDVVEGGARESLVAGRCAPPRRGSAAGYAPTSVPRRRRSRGGTRVPGAPRERVVPEREGSGSAS